MSIENNELIMSALDKIVKIGKKKGVLTVDEVTRALVVDADASRTDVEEAFEYLEKQHVLVVESQPEENTAKDIPTDDAVRIFLNAIGKYPLLTAEEERELRKRKKEGDDEANDKYDKSNLRLVDSVDKNYI